jgi:hypothetical protein
MMDVYQFSTLPCDAVHAAVGDLSQWQRAARPRSRDLLRQHATPRQTDKQKAQQHTAGHALLAAASGLTVALVCRKSSRADHAQRLFNRTRRHVLEPNEYEGVEEFEPINVYKKLKADFIGAWGSLGDGDFALRLFGIFVVGLVPGAYFGNLVFQTDDPETGQLVPINAAAAALVASTIGFSFLLMILVVLAFKWDEVNKLLQRSQYVVEYDPTQKMDFGSGSGGAYSYNQVKTQEDIDRDRLLANYETEPAIGRIRVYLLATLPAIATSLAGSATLGEIRKAAPEKEEEGDNVALVDGAWKFVPKQKKKVCGTGCVPGLED